MSAPEAIRDRGAATPEGGEAPFDAIVVGSGFGGAVTACRLAEAGQRVCILERGRRFEAGDFPTYPAQEDASVPSDAPDEAHDRVQPDVSRLLWKLGNGIWDLRDLGGLVVGQAAGLGGGSLVYANVHLRPPAHVFDARWPASHRREALDPWYDLAACMLDVAPLPEEHGALPKRMQLDRAASELGAGGTYLRGFDPPLAVRFQAGENAFGVKQRACDLEGNCTFGCPQHAKSTLDLTYLRRAEELGATVVTLAEVIWVEQISARGAARFRVEYRDHLASEALRPVFATNVFLCAGAVNTTELMLRSREAGKLRPTGAGLGARFHPNQDALAVVFDCDERHELDRGPTITSSLLYDREADETDPAARWRLAFAGATAEPVVGGVITCGGSGRARVAAPPYRLDGVYEHGTARGELLLVDLEGAFDEGAALTMGDRPCGRVAASPQPVRHWMLVQDGGLPSALEPALGMFRSPLWLRRNAFREAPVRRGDGSGRDASKDAGAREPRAAVSQRIGYAPLPFANLAELASGLTRSATRGLSLTHEVGERGLLLGRGLRGETDGEDRRWSLLPGQLSEALDRIGRRTLDDVGLAAEEVVADFLDDAAAQVGPLLDQAVSRFDDGLKGQVEDLELASRALRLGVQLLWGSQGGLARAVAQRLLGAAVPAEGGLSEAAIQLAQRLLDYRLGDGRTAVLLSMGLDSAPGRLALELPEEPEPGTELRGARSGARAILLKSQVSRGSRIAGNAAGEVIYAAATRDFEPGEVILASQRPIGVHAGRREVRADAGGPELGALVSGVPLAGLHFEPRPEAAPALRTAPLRATLPAAVDTPERGVQERILRDLASAWGGELRTDPLWTFLGRRITVHAQGGCPMGPPVWGVTDEDGAVHGCPGLYVMDAAAFPGPVGANPSATIAAVAERKVARFLEVRLGRDAEVVRALAKQREEATAWVDARGREALDPLGCGAAAPGPRSAAPAHRPIDLRFRETMVGTVSDDSPLAVSTSIRAHVDDLAGFLARHRRDSTVAIAVEAGSTLTLGSRTLELDPARSSIRVMVDGGRDETGRERRTLEYTLVGPGCRLEGVKTVRDEAGADVWEDTTTLVFTLAEDGRPQRCGVLRLPAAEFFGEQIPSFEVDTDDPARQAWAIASFGRFFLGHLVDVYLPAFDRVVELARGVTDRGHV